MAVLVELQHRDPGPRSLGVAFWLLCQVTSRDVSPSYGWVTGPWSLTPGGPDHHGEQQQFHGEENHHQGEHLPQCGAVVRCRCDGSWVMMVW